MPTWQNGGPDGLGGAVAGSGRSRAFTKGGQNIDLRIEPDGSPFPRNGAGVILQLFATRAAAGAVRTRRQNEEAAAAPG